MFVSTSGCARKGKNSEEDFYLLRQSMVEVQLKGRDITDHRVLDVMYRVPRHLFVPPKRRSSAYGDFPLPIGYRQTISQPYIVAYMTQALNLQGDEKVLEIGTGSGYQAAVLAELCARVYTIEIVPELAESAAARLKEMDYDNVEVKYGDGYLGWEEHAPFDAVIVTAAPPEVPQTLIDQLSIGGKLIVPEGTAFQELRLYTKTKRGVSCEDLIFVRFVPMIHGDE